MLACHPGLKWDLVSIENPAFGFVLHTVPGRCRDADAETHTQTLGGTLWKMRREGCMGNTKKNTQFALFLRLMALGR